ncbi:MAG: transketolase C-terminal domain-containing protein, partial [Candidatus Tumulicola sp.]
ILELAETHTRFITLEEHSLAGGFGSAIAEFVSDRGLTLGVERVGVANVLVQHDSQDKQRAMFGLHAGAVAARVAAMMDLSVAR